MATGLVMKISRLLMLGAVLAAAPALAQQAAPSAKTTEQQARSYVASALMTGAAPMILSDDVTIGPELRERLGLAPDAGSRAAYEALVKLTAGKPLTVRPAIRDEVARVQARPEPSKPLFAVELAQDTLIVQYDLERDNLSFVGQPSAAPVAAPAVEAPQPAAPARPPQVVEPQLPHAVKPAPPLEVAPPPLRRTGPCVIRPVMSDQDLANCGAAPR